MSALLRAYRNAYAGLPREAWLLAAVIFVNRCGTMVLPFLALYLKTEQGYSAASAGRMLAVYGLGAVMGAQLGGRLTQKFGGVPVAFVALLLAAPGFWVIPFCRGVAPLCCALLYLSVVFEAMRPAIGTSTIEFCPADRHAKAFALNRLAMNLGMSVGPVVGGLLATVDYALLFLVNGVFVVLSAIVVAASFDLPPLARRSEAAWPRPEIRSPSGGRSPWGDRRYLAYLGLQLASGVVFFQIIGALPLFWSEQLGLSEPRIGLLFVGNTLLIVALEMLLTERLSDRAPLRVVAWGMALVGLGFGLQPLGGLLGLAGGGGFAMAAVLVPIWTVGEMLTSPFSLAYVAKASNGGQRGAYMGLFSTTMAAAFVLAPLVGTTLYELDPRLPWAACLAAAFVLPLGYAALGRGKPVGDDLALAAAAEQAGCEGEKKERQATRFGDPLTAGATGRESVSP